MVEVMRDDDGDNGVGDGADAGDVSGGHGRAGGDGVTTFFFVTTAAMLVMFLTNN